MALNYLTNLHIILYKIIGIKKKKKTSNASGLSIASSGSGEFVHTSALSQPLIFQPHSGRPNTSAHQVCTYHLLYGYKIDDKMTIFQILRIS